jgi:hypothetical protein
MKRKRDVRGAECVCRERVAELATSKEATAPLIFLAYTPTLNDALCFPQQSQYARICCLLEPRSPNKLKYTRVVLKSIISDRLKRLRRGKAL